jgi:hypothetical protein
MKTGWENRFRKFIFPVILSLGILMLVSLACSEGNKYGIGGSDPDQLPTQKSPTTPAQAVEPLPVTSQAASTTLNFSEIRDYYGPACPDGEEENAPYRWSVEMLIDPKNNAYEGTIKFHNCPDGGRASYRVSGSSDGSLLHLTGDLVGGGGDLFGTVPAQQTFTFNPATGVIEPNLAP